MVYVLSRKLLMIWLTIFLQGVYGAWDDSRNHNGIHRVRTIRSKKISLIFAEQSRKTRELTPISSPDLIVTLTAERRKKDPSFDESLFFRE